MYGGKLSQQNGLKRRKLQLILKSMHLNLAYKRHLKLWIAFHLFWCQLLQSYVSVAIWLYDFLAHFKLHI